MTLGAGLIAADSAPEGVDGTLVQAESAIAAASAAAAARIDRELRKMGGW
jgi:hypothetical protein